MSLKPLTLNEAAIGHECPKCKQTITAEVVEKIRNIRRVNIHKALAIAREKRVKFGPKPGIDARLALEMREKGMSFREIGEHFNRTATRVCKVINDWRKQNESESLLSNVPVQETN